MKKKIVLLQGAFDILHAAHIRAFKFAKSQGDYLIVALNTDRLIKKYKGREPVVPWGQRKIMIAACRYVDRVVEAPEFSPLKLLKKHKVSVYVISREWERTKSAEFAYMKKTGGKVKFASRSRTISSTAIREKLLKRHLDAQRANNNGNGHDTNSRSVAGATDYSTMPPPVLVETATGIVREGESGENGTRLL